ncbi:MAG: tubulin-like doman-containing protein [Desulfobacterales bacterium]|nr:tubulin-like doman-containing protein [Desulfobacterales bacterium]
MAQDSASKKGKGHRKINKLFGAARPRKRTVNKVQRTLYIGIGGTGGRTLLKTKNQFLEKYGFIPNTVKFLHIDTDESPRITSGAHDLFFEPHEMVQIQVNDPMAVVNNVNSIAEFWPKGVLADPIVDGCGQRRINGRLAFHFRAYEICNTIRTVFEELQSPHLISSHPDVYEVPPTKAVRVILVASDSGGTGSGMALDIGRYIREGLFDGSPEHQLLGFFITYTAFENEANTDLVHANAYAFWKELDYMANNDPRKAPGITLHDLRLPREDRKGAGSLQPFNKIMSIDVQNDSFAYKREDIEDNLSRILFLASGYLAGNAISIWKNAATMPWLGKHPFLSGIGISELVYRGDEISGYATVGLVRKLVDTVLLQEEIEEATESDVLSRLNSWQLVEADKDQVIDRILDPNAVTHERIPGKYDRQTAENFLGAIQRNSARLLNGLEKTARDNGEKVRRKAMDDLHSHVHEISNRPGGLLCLEQFLRQCREFLASYREMMIDEINEFVPEKDERTQAVDLARKQVREAAGKIFGRGSRLKKGYENLAAAGRAWLMVEAEILRREQAAAVYKELLHKTDRLKAQAQALRNSCEMASNRAIGEMQAVVSRRRQRKPNEIEVGKDYSDQVIAAADVSAYLDKFTSSPSFLDLAQRSGDELFEGFRQYCEDLPQIQFLQDKDLDSVLSEMDGERLKKLLADMDRFSQPLWKWDTSFRNFSENRKTENIFLIGCGSTVDNVFNRLNLLEYLPSKGVGKPVIVGTGDHNRIVCVRIEDAVPPFALKSLAACKGRYEQAKRQSIAMRDKGFNRIAFEIDGRWEDTLPDIFPSHENEEDFQVWALAHVPEVFGIITRNGAHYYAHSRKSGRPADDYKIPLAQGRVAAYEKYIRDDDLRHEHQLLITQRSKKMGDSELAARLREYVDNELMEQVRAITEPDLKQLVEKEIHAINEFITQLSSL